MPNSQHFPALFRRCYECPPETPTCPPCGEGETCLLQAPSCKSCASATCVKAGSLPGQLEPKKASATPAIAGGVVGGVFFIILLTVFIWWFCIRKRRQQWDEQVWTETEQTFNGAEKQNQGGLNREARQSTRSLRSIASTARSRASNVIQIAYIPGVTNRSPTESPGLMVPPVPALPYGYATNSNSTSPNFDEDRFFMPDDLARNSTASDLSARQSLSPSLARASNATTIYRSYAEVSPRPAQQALRGKAAVVTVNKSGNNSPSESDISADGPKGIMNSHIVARNVTARPIQVKKSNSVKNGKVPTLANLQAAASNNRINLHAQAEKTEERSEDETDASTHLMTTIRSAHQSAAATIIEDSPAMKHGQFVNISSSASSASDNGAAISAPSSTSAAAGRRSAQRPSPSGSTSSGQRLSYRHKKSGSLSSLIEEAVNRAARDPIHGGLGSISEAGGQHDHNTHNHPSSQGRGGGHVRSDSASGGSGMGPFSDANEVRESNSRSS